jgi:hypothetical protein
MWIKPSCITFLLIRFRIKEYPGFVIPISLHTFEELIEAAKDLFWLIERLFPLRQKPYAQLWNNCQESHLFKYHFSFTSFLSQCGVFLDEIKKYGKWKVMEIDTDEIFISIDVL